MNNDIVLPDIHKPLHDTKLNKVIFSTVSEALEELKKVYQITTDYKLSQILANNGVCIQCIQMKSYRSGAKISETKAKQLYNLYGFIISEVVFK